ncbi:YbaB/EbfC family nucleoid-associated protein [Amycolatopsis benzoatilytica]|uniref:YbaB/EbfC family nucleoid-associated protein n=1 Tax=Amycolatopsis benzoatilytica TaxID=346045 RepID=UPI00316ABDBE
MAVESPFRFDLRAEHQRLAGDIRSTQRRMAEIRADAESDDGLISATVGGAGELLDLRLDPRIYRKTDSAALAKDIAGTIHRAVERAEQECIEIVASLLPSDATPENTDLRFDPLLHELDRRARGAVR